MDPPICEPSWPCPGISGRSFDPLRREQVAFAFGLGAHVCPGETIATMIALTGIEQLLAAGVELERLTEPTGYRQHADPPVPHLTLGPEHSGG